MIFRHFIEMEIGVDPILLAVKGGYFIEIFLNIGKMSQPGSYSSQLGTTQVDICPLSQTIGEISGGC